MSAQDIRALTPVNRRLGGRVAGPAYWRRYLADVPTWALEDTLVRRREESECLDAIAIGDDFIVDPIASLVTWRGVDYVIAGRPMEVIYALASGWLAGRRRMRSTSLAQAVWFDRPEAEARPGMWSAVRDLRKAIPGLIAGGWPQHTGYHLAIPTDAVARRVECGR